MFVAGVYVRLCSKADKLVKVVNVDMDKHPEETRQDLLHCTYVRFGKRYTFITPTTLDREDILIIDLVFNPIHQ